MPNDYFGSVRFTMSARLYPWQTGEPDGYVTPVTGKVGLYLAKLDRTVTVARMKLKVIHLAALHRSAWGVFYVCDCHSQELTDVYCELLAKVGDQKISLNPEGDAEWKSVLIIEELTMRPKFRRRPRLLQQAVEAAINAFCPEGVVIGFHEGIELSISEWEKLSFRVLPKSGMVYFDSTLDDPDNAHEPQDDLP